MAQRKVFIKKDNALLKFADKLLFMMYWVWAEGVHWLRVTADAGTVLNRTITEDYYEMAETNDMLDTIRVGYLADAGRKLRTSGTSTFFTKLYSLLGVIDAAQATSTSQPYQFFDGGLKNPNNDARFMTHTAVSFAANEAWSVTTALNWNADALATIQGYCGTSLARLTPQMISAAVYSLVNTLGDQINSTISSRPYIGKTAIITFTANGLGSLSLYINGVFKITVAGVTSFASTDLLRGRSAQIAGRVFAHFIRSGALTQTQITAEHAFLSATYPEIPSVTIGSQTFGEFNVESVGTPMGNVAQEMQAAANVEKITNAADRDFSSDTGFWTKGTGWTIGTNKLNYSGSTATAFQRLNFLTTSKYYKIVVKVDAISGLFVFSGSSFSNTLTERTLLNGTNTYYLLSNSVNFQIVSPTGAATIDIDNVSIEEVGWTGSTALYDAIYAQTVGTAAQKTTAALRAAAMWCHYNNDPLNGAYLGKLYNWYAVALLQEDIDAYNVANPTAPWGWRVPTSTDYTTLATTLGGTAVAGGKMKFAGLDWWNTPNTGADNSSGFSALANGLRSGSTGAFSEIKASSPIWTLTQDSTSAQRVSIGSGAINIEIELRAKTTGYSLRLIKV